MNRSKPRLDNEVSLREVLTGGRPSDPVRARRWVYLRFMLFAIFAIPFAIYGTYALSFASPGYKPLREVGYWHFFSRFVIINSHINIMGLLLLIYILGIVFAPHIQRRIESGQGMEKVLNVRKSTLVFWLLGIAGFTLGPLVPSWRLPWNQFFNQAEPNILEFTVLCTFWFTFARRLWKK